jgi:hypothetical protein
LWTLTVRPQPGRETAPNHRGQVIRTKDTRLGNVDRARDHLQRQPTAQYRAAEANHPHRAAPNARTCRRQRAASPRSRHCT